MRKRTGARLTVFVIAAITGWCFFTGGRSYARRPSAGTVQRPPIVGVANIGLRISNLARSQQFYSDGLGFDLAFTTSAPNGLRTSYFEVNNHQYVELTPSLQPSEDRLIHIGLETTDVRELRSYLAAEGVRVPRNVRRLPDGTLGFEVTDPDGHRVQFVQYVRGSDEARHSGKILSRRRLSKHMLHVGITVQNQARADAFYKDILGLRAFWNVWAAGGCCIDMRLPNGTDWVEFMMHPRPLPPSRLGGPPHFALGMNNYAQVYKEVLKRGLKPTRPRIGRDGKWEFNLFDPDRTRVEFMTIITVRPPNPPFTP